MPDKQVPKSFLYLLFAGLAMTLLGACSAAPIASTSEESSSSQAGQVEPPTPIATVVPAASPTADATDVVPTETATVEPEPVLYQLVADRSEARFYIDELLFGEPKTVVGRTKDITGELTVDLSFPALAQVGPIQVNARDLTTDNSFRNRALRRQILESTKDEYQYIFFEPKALDGLPDQITLGEPVSFVMTGDLTIRDLTMPVSFDLTVTPISEIEISGSATAIVLRSDFALEIPSVTGVAEVSEEVRLEFDFFALSASP